jgi:hypothetical protein
LGAALRQSQSLCSDAAPHGSGLAWAGRACRAPTKTIGNATARRSTEANYLAVITKLDGNAGVSCADGETATAEKITLPLGSRAMVRA